MPDFLSVQYVAPDGPREIFLRKQTYCTEEGFGTHATIYPVTVTVARYGGTYEGSHWLAFPVYPHILAKQEWQDWMGSDIECAEWWDRANRENWPVGKGITSNLAYLDLLRIAAAKAGFDLAEWATDPTWDRDELRRRDGENPAI